MIEIKDIEKLAELARLEVPQAEKEALAHDVDTILKYVGQITEASALSGADKINNTKENTIVSNVFRDDNVVHDSGIYTDDLLGEVPSKENGFVKVKKII